VAPLAPNSAVVHDASYRDPAGFVFEREGVLYRQINPAAREDYTTLIASGLYADLAGRGDLVAHEEADVALSPDGLAFRVIRPERIGFISYPYEWCFGQLKDAALLTLRLQKTAMAHGMSLKDATAFNVAFEGGRPVLIDTLSFERLEPGAPWVAYRQFCESFLAPLALMSAVDPRLNQLLRPWLDGVPLDLAQKLLPWRSRLRPGLLVHLQLHAAAQRRLAGRTPAAPAQRRRVHATAVPALVDSLERTVRALDWSPGGTVWGDYYEATNYTDAAFAHKREIVGAAIDRLAPSCVWDLGANDGTFSRLASGRGIPTIAFDVDPAAVEKNYRRVVHAKETHLLPLLLDLTNPSAASGWANRERETIAGRGPADLALALALVHHLAIGHNVPLPRVAGFLASLARALVIEFVPKDDSQVQRMLASRKDVFDGYTQDAFEQAFAARFRIEQAVPVRESKRVVYVMRRTA
jgi:ribosomal protein L11 methylase PrmA